jgi:ferric-dicitrate binding protein FerR (iron transport regulator)
VKPTEPPLPPRWIAGRGQDTRANEARAMLRSATPGLDGAARERTWRAIVGRLDEAEAHPSPRPRLALAAAVAAFCLLLLAVWLVRSWTPTDGSITVIGGDAVLVGPSGPRPIDGTEPLRLPARVEVGASGEARVALARGVRLRVGAETRVRLLPDGAELEAGELAHRVRKGQGAWTTRLGRYRVTVLGTQFWTARRGSDATVCVREGRVRVTDAGGQILATLAAGDAWRSSPTAPVLPGDVGCSAAGGGAVRAAVDRTPDRAPQIDSSAGRAPESAPAPSSSMLAAPVVVAPRPADRVEARLAPVQAAEHPAATRAAAPPADRPELGGPPSTGASAAGAPAATVAPDPEAPASADLAEQIAAYRLGLSRRTAGDAPGAIAAWLEVRRRWPRGALAREVDLGILEARLQGGSAQALAEATRFLRVHPGSEQRGEVLAIRAQLLHQTARHAEALADYDAALAARPARRRQEAVFGRASCLHALARMDEARTAYRQYLDRYPEGRFAERARAALGGEPP